MTRGDSVMATVLAILILARLSRELEDSTALATSSDLAPRSPEAARALAGEANETSGNASIREEG